MKVEDFLHFTTGDGALMFVAESQRRKSHRAGEVVGYITVYQSENYFYLPYAVTKRDGKGEVSAAPYWNILRHWLKRQRWSIF